MKTKIHQKSFKQIFQRTKGEKKIRRGYIVAFVLLILACLVTLFMNKRMEDHALRVEHTNKFISGLERLLSRVKDAETGERGYLITRDPVLFESYVGSYDAADSIFSMINGMATKNERQRSQLAELKTTLSARAAISRSSIAEFERNNKMLSDSSHSLMFESKNRMDKLRGDISRLQHTETLLLADREQQLKNSITALNVLTLVSLVIASLLVCFGFITYSRENRSKKIAGEAYELQLKTQIEELNLANDELMRIRSEEKFAATGRIARTIAHEVRNPLTNINLAVEQLKGELKPDESQVYLFDMIDRNTNRINQLISDLLSSTKFAELIYERVPLNDVLDEALSDAADRISLINVKVEKQYDAGMCEVLVDKRKLKIAFLNIIINALEAMSGKDDGYLLIKTSSADGKCRITITDNGSGMDSDAVSHMFEPYYTTRAKGNGLGLTNTQNVILNHKGEIFVESERDKGTSFTVQLHIG